MNKVIHREKGTYPNVIPLAPDSNLGIEGKRINQFPHIVEDEHKPESKVDGNHV